MRGERRETKRGRARKKEKSEGKGGVNRENGERKGGGRERKAKTCCCYSW